MAANDDYLEGQVFEGRYDAFNVVQDSGLKIWSRVIQVQPNHKHVVEAPVSFGSFFTPGSIPVITATLATSDRIRTTLTIRGLDGGRKPSSAGFTAVLYYINSEGQNLVFNNYQHVHIIAMGY